MPQELRKQEGVASPQSGSPVEPESDAAPRSARGIVIACILLLSVYFCYSARPGLHAYFTQDDAGNLLNMHKYWDRSAWDVLTTPLRVVTGAFRPLGGVFYYTLYRYAGFNPLPFRAVCLGLMLANVLLAFALLRRLSGSLAVALFGAFLMANHPAMLELLYSSGSIYEILCFLFYFLAVWRYLIWRQAGQSRGATSLSWPQLAALLVLTGCALDSKEMAMTLPGALLLIELVYFPPRTWSLRSGLEFLWRQGRAALAVACLVVPTIAAKTLTRNPLSEDPRYAEHSLRATLDAMCGFHSFLFYRDIWLGGLPIAGLLALWTAMAFAAVALRSRPMKFGLLFLIGSLLPVCLIPPRGGYMLYIPLIGWALYTGCLFQWLGRRLVAAAHLRPRNALASKIAGFAAALLLLGYLHAARLAPNADYQQRAQSDMRFIIEHLRQAHPHLAKGSSLLVVDDPLPVGFGLLFLANLAYDDPTLNVDRVQMLRHPLSGDEVTRFDYVLAGEWYLHDVRNPSDKRKPVDLRLRPAPTGYTVEIPEYAGQTVDLVIRTIAGGRSKRQLIRDCTLDAAGNSEVLALAADGVSSIEARWIRPRGGEWMSAASRARQQAVATLRKAD